MTAGFYGKNMFSFVRNCQSVTFKFKKFIYLFILAVPGLCCCAGFSLVAEGGGYSLVVVHGLLVAVVSLVEHGLCACWLQRAQ